MWREFEPSATAARTTTLKAADRTMPIEDLCASWVRVAGGVNFVKLCVQIPVRLPPFAGAKRKSRCAQNYAILLPQIIIHTR